MRPRSSVLSPRSLEVAARGGDSAPRGPPVVATCQMRAVRPSADQMLAWVRGGVPFSPSPSIHTALSHERVMVSSVIEGAATVSGIRYHLLFRRFSPRRTPFRNRSVTKAEPRWHAHSPRTEHRRDTCHSPLGRPGLGVCGIAAEWSSCLCGAVAGFAQELWVT